MKTEEISIDDFKLIKSFYPEFTRKPGVRSNHFIIGWSELMPVVEKCAKITIDMECKSKKQFKELIKYWNVVTIGLVKPSLKDTYTAVVNYIKWYSALDGTKL